VGDDRLTGDLDANRLQGNEGVDTLAGDGGDDNLQGGSGNDILTGGAGQDALYGGAGVDVMNGGAGDDRYFLYNDEDASEVIADDSGLDTAETWLANYSLAASPSVENLVGSRWDAQTLTGNRADNRITGAAGDDTLDGAAGSDTLEGGAGEDTLRGRDGADTLLGGRGADVLFGGSGDDILDGDDASVLPSGVGFGSGVLIKDAGAGNSALERAIHVTNLFSLAPDADIGDAATKPHVTVRGTGDGTIDWYAVTIANPGVTLVLDIDRAGLSGSLDTAIRVYDAGRMHRAFNDDAAITLGAGGSTSVDDSYLTFTAPAAGVYYISVARYGEYGVPAGSEYELQISVDDGGGADTLNGGPGQRRAPRAAAATTLPAIWTRPGA
jgi:Ca2+-binding RTX toxin-like protein